jgi:hypothetical protein
MKPGGIMGEKQINVLTEEMVEAKLKSFADQIIKSQPREFMTFEEFREKIIDWSESTIRRRYKEDGFPLLRDGGGFVIPKKEMELWFKKRPRENG